VTIPPSPSLPRVIAFARLVTGIFFVFFGQYKVFGSAFARTGFAHYLDGYIRETAVSFYRPVLSHLVLPHVVYFGYFVGAVELFIGIALIAGIWVRAASVLGALHMLSLTLATWWGPGHGAPVWQYFGAELDHLPLLLLFLIFFTAKAASFREWGGRAK
jgi:thiosulfate dehydrogenase (quinone) large subunit